MEAELSELRLKKLLKVWEVGRDMWLGGSEYISEGELDILRKQIVMGVGGLPRVN